MPHSVSPSQVAAATSESRVLMKASEKLFHKQHAELRQAKKDWRRDQVQIESLTNKVGRLSLPPSVVHSCPHS